MSADAQAVGLLGGTFDPVHCGHLRLALEMRQGLNLHAVRLIPSAVPPHRPSPRASTAQRLKMVRAAVEGLPGLEVDETEIQRPGLSYTVDTLAALRRIDPDRPFCLIVGMDAFLSIESWHRWRDILSLAHIAVARRPGSPLPAAGGMLEEMLSAHSSNDLADCQRHKAGCVFLRELPVLDISSSRIRKLASAGRPLCCLVSERVLQIIREEELYADGD